MGEEETFDGKALAEKLSKLNCSQQSIESLSRKCISFRKKAKHIVELWDKLFKTAQPEQCVSLLYLANDILQNSRRKGTEFVNEFWKVLPLALKHVCDSGDENGKKVATRLVGIWEDRKVFGSRGQILKEGILSVSNEKGSSNTIKVDKKDTNPIKLGKRDAQSLRVKVAVGVLPEKIISTFHLVHDVNVNEESAVKKYEGAVSCVGEMEKDIEKFSSQGNLQSNSELKGKIEEQEEILKKSITLLENSEATRMKLISHLKEALQDQEMKMEEISSKMQVVRGQIEKTKNIRERLTANTSVVPGTCFANMKVNEEESTKAAAAAVVAKLVASTSSAQMLSSIFSSFAEESASISNGVSLPFAPPEKKLKLDNNLDGQGQGGNFNSNSDTYFMTTPQSMGQSMGQSMSQGVYPYNTQATYPSLPVSMPYNYNGNNVNTPPFMGYANATAPPPQQTLEQPPQQQEMNGGYYRPPGIGFY